MINELAVVYDANTIKQQRKKAITFSLAYMGSFFGVVCCFSLV